MEVENTASTKLHDEEKFAGAVLDAKPETELVDSSSEEDRDEEPPVCSCLWSLKYHNE